MVPFHKGLLSHEKPRTQVLHSAEFESMPKKRKWEEPFAREFFKDSNPETKKPLFDIELHLNTPFPADKLRQFLSIQSGQIASPHHGSLDLDLNLTCDSLRKNENAVKQNLGEHHDDLLFKEPSKCKKGISDGPSWLSAASSEGEHKEMVATVCMRCHMLVMLCKSSPSCPNCKFMHPPDQSPSNFLKKRCSLFC